MSAPFTIETPKIYQDVPRYCETVPATGFDLNRYYYFNKNSDFFLSLLEYRNCVVYNAKELSNFLTTRPKISNDINNTIQIAQEVFGHEQRTYVELFSDEEDGGGHNEVFLNIILKEYSEENVEKFYKIHKWFVENIYQYRHEFNINVEFE